MKSYYLLCPSPKLYYMTSNHCNLQIIHLELIQYNIDCLTSSRSVVVMSMDSKRWVSLV